MIPIKTIEPAAIAPTIHIGTLVARYARPRKVTPEKIILKLLNNTPMIINALGIIKNKNGLKLTRRR